MKKLLAITIALTMILTVFVPSFAALVPDDGTMDSTAVGPDKAVIQTSTTLDGGGIATTWSVTYPATTTLNWGAAVGRPTTAIAYSATTHLEAGKSLKLTVAPSAAAKMTYQGAASGVTQTLSYSLKEAGTTSGSYVALTPLTASAVATVNKTAYVDVVSSDWDNAPVGEYGDLISFTVEIL